MLNNIQPQFVTKILGKRLLFTCLVVAFCVLHTFGRVSNSTRGQWTEKQAWDWAQKIGVIKGFNAPVAPYPGMERIDILKKASALGYNSVRIWIPPGERATDFLKSILEEAERCHMTVSPVLRTNAYFDNKNLGDRERNIKDYLAATVGKYKDDPRIIFWDVANEPALKYSFEGKAWESGALEEIALVKNIVKWSRELGPSQPVTTSALFLTEHIYNHNKVHDALKELGAMSDVHNFHLYDLSVGRMKALDDMVAILKKLGNRPIICTEIVGRTRGGTFARSLTAFAKYGIHFYNWGLYAGDANWDVAWGLSSFEPYEPWFHDVLHPDGDPYEWRDLEWIRNYHFAKEGEQTDPGAEWTERWDKWRAWRWAATGALKGFDLNFTADYPRLKKSLARAKSLGYNSLKVKFDLTSWLADTSKYYNRINLLLQVAAENHMGVLPLLLTDQDAGKSSVDIDAFVSGIVKKYGFDTRVIAWNLYSEPGKSGISKDSIKKIIALAFRVARFEFPNQPLTATPLASVRKFDQDFKYADELVHGHWNGWKQVQFGGSSDAELCNYIWSLSDIISFESEMDMPETGWLLNVANRYGRPLICTNWYPASESIGNKTLELFSRNLVHWFNNSKNLSSQAITSFVFTKVATPRR